MSFRAIDYKSDIAELVIPRPADAHKGTFGHALLVAGSYGMAGAAVLAAKGALRSGLGLLTVHVPLCNRIILQCSVPEAMVRTDTDECCFTDKDIDTGRYRAVGIGPGLGRNGKSVTALYDLLENTRCPMVIDADALNMIASHRNMLEKIPAGSILTPHPMELARLTEKEDNPQERIERAAALAMEHDVTVIVKGAPSAVVTSEGNCYICTTGCQGMATAGAGDVLTGVVMALLAGGYGSIEAARVAAHIHGLAGQIAAERLGMTGMTSLDLAETLPYAWKQMEKNEHRENGTMRIQEDF